MDKLWTFQSRLEIPLAHVTDAEADPEVVRGWKGWRGPGAQVPGVIVAGTFHQGAADKLLALLGVGSADEVGEVCCGGCGDGGLADASVEGLQDRGHLVQGVADSVGG
jgi:hypothetical protein